MEEDSDQQQVLAAASPAQRIIQPFQYFPVERGLFMVAVVCLVLGFPILLFRENIRYLPFGFLVIVMPGVGVILLALAMTIAEIHFRRSAVSTIAIVTRERRLVENYFTPPTTKKPAKRPPKQTATKLPTIEVHFTTQTGERITLEILAYSLMQAEIGQPVAVYYIPLKPQVAALKAKWSVTFGLSAFYCIFGAAFIAGGLTLFR